MNPIIVTYKIGDEIIEHRLPVNIIGVLSTPEGHTSKGHTKVEQKNKRFHRHNTKNNLPSQ